ncbi:carboxypeptidase-like regulatory domain-containing protein [Litoribaculum gwangyangense]|uniref:Carboxypeptidase-like regulatory domain-containing protein n=1 Tax=Litoribaculum gwangyangense TaxID=1130722 RepID=A0ABP9BUX5_9FLAO
MKQIIFLVAFLISAFTFAQNTGSIVGSVLDVEENNTPLTLAKVILKETGAEALSDENGNFKFENLKEGSYTLVSSFVGYETKALETMVVSNKTNTVTLQLGASTLSLDDLMLAFASEDKKETASVTNN